MNPSSDCGLCRLHHLSSFEVWPLSPRLDVSVCTPICEFYVKKDDDPKGRIVLAIPIGANIGGMATPIGTPPNIIALGYLNKTQAR
ncbi:MAG: hypothetical protein LIP03_03625 [Bacteroidales bacterium]|nr:hypothetical protein [Bacteroidales bacterium]